MYIPRSYRLEDKDKILQFIQQYPFAALITSHDNQPMATHLPFIIEKDATELTLLSHIAKGNPQWKLLEGNQVLIIFQKPNAYISPSLYEKKQNVPTWNYIAVHVYGTITLLPERADAINVLEKTMDIFEHDFLQQWEDLDVNYINKLLKGMVAFSIKIDRWEAQEKLSQDMTYKEQQTIADNLSQSDDNSARELGQIMKKQL